jgi:DNA transformation protein and related proteins
MAGIDREFADYCCELLSSQGPCTARRMFGGWGIHIDGLTIAILADLGGGATLWLKSAPDNAQRYTDAGCQRFEYAAKDKTMRMNYYSAPADAMESPPLMAPWARLALEAALLARNKPTAKNARRTPKLPEGNKATRRRAAPKAG